MIVEYLDLADYVGIAAEVTGLDEAVVLKVNTRERLELMKYDPKVRRHVMFREER